MDIPFEYVLPIMWGIQAGREYYVSICPVRLIPKLFPFDDEEIQPEMRAQWTINRSLVPEIVRDILDNPRNYTFCAIMTAYIKKSLCLPLTPKEERLENARVLAGREE